MKSDGLRAQSAHRYVGRDITGKRRFSVAVPVAEAWGCMRPTLRALFAAAHSGCRCWSGRERRQQNAHSSSSSPMFSARISTTAADRSLMQRPRVRAAEQAGCSAEDLAADPPMPVERA